jgi:hypothetical protein
MPILFFGREFWERVVNFDTAEEAAGRGAGGRDRCSRRGFRSTTSNGSCSNGWAFVEAELVPTPRSLATDESRTCSPR